MIARNTCFGYKGKALDVDRIRHDLNVDYIVDGSVQRVERRVRVNVHLIDAHSGRNNWSERYDGEIAELFDLQDDITAKVVGRIEPEIGLADRRKVVHSRPANLLAWDCYHLGIYHFYKFTGEDNIEAQQLFLQCQELDPEFGEGHAWWAYAVVLGGAP